MVSVLASAVDHGFSQTKDYKFDICCFSTKHAVLGRSWFEIGIMCPNGATCLPTDCCFSKLAL